MIIEMRVNVAVFSLEITRIAYQTCYVSFKRYWIFYCEWCVLVNQTSFSSSRPYSSLDILQFPLLILQSEDFHLSPGLCDERSCQLVVFCWSLRHIKTSMTSDGISTRFRAFLRVPGYTQKCSYPCE